MNAPSPTGPLADNVAFWQSQSARLERDRHNLIYILYAALPVALACYLVSRIVWLTAFAGGTLICAWGLGMYMVTVRRGEYEFALGQARAELLRAQQAEHKP